MVPVRWRQAFLIACDAEEPCPNCGEQEVIHLLDVDTEQQQ